MKNLVSLAAVKARLNLQDTTDDNLIAALISTVSLLFDQHTNRALDREENTIYQFRADSLTIILPRYPLESITSFQERSSHTSPWTICRPNYTIDSATGTVEFRSPIGDYFTQARVIYTGGYSWDEPLPEGATPLPEAIKLFAQEQVVHWYSNRDRLGITSLSSTVGSAQPILGLIPIVQEGLKPHRRITI